MGRDCRLVLKILSDDKLAPSVLCIDTEQSYMSELQDLINIRYSSFLRNSWGCSQKSGCTVSGLHTVWKDRILVKGEHDLSAVLEVKFLSGVRCHNSKDVLL
jgi:hypothetical protein